MNIFDLKTKVIYRPDVGMNNVTLCSLLRDVIERNKQIKNKASTGKQVRSEENENSSRFVFCL